jgi:hypothetical protein
VPQPTPYDRQNSFTLIAQANPAKPYTGADLDAEFNAIKVSLDELLANLALIQRADGAIANASIGPDQLAAALEIGINPPTAWSATTVHFMGDTVFNGANFYRALEDHTSGADFATDLAAGQWVFLADFLGAFDPLVLNDGDVTTPKLADGAVTAAKIATLAVNSARLAANAVTSEKLADGAVTEDKIAAAAVTSGKIATNAVSSAKIADEAVTSAKIPDAAITLAKIQNLSANKLLGSVAGGAPEQIALTAAGRALLDDADAAAQRVTLSAAARSQTAEPFYGAILGSLSNRSYTLVLKATEGGMITEATTKCVSGTATATFKINTTALGGAANAVSSAEQSQAQASNNVFVAGDDIVVTISANASCVDFSFSLKWTRTLI